MTSRKLPKVLYVVGQLGKGGAEQQLYYLLKYSNAQSSVVVLEKNPTDAYWAHPIRELGCKLIELRRTHNFEVRRLRQLITIFNQEEPDIVVIFGDGHSGIYGRLAAVITHPPNIIIGERQHPSSNPRWLTFLKHILNHRVDYIVTNSYSAAHYLQREKRIRAEKVLTIANGIELDRFTTPKSMLPYPFHEEWRNKLIVGTVGSVTVKKSPTTFVSVAAKVLSKRSNVRFVHIGKGPLWVSAKELSAELGIADKIHWLGPRDDVPHLLPYFDIFLLTSRFEGMPNAVLEALAAKLPCVVTDVGDCSKLVQNGINGYVLPVGDDWGLVERICHLLDDATLRETMARESFNLIQEYEVTRMAEKYDALYFKLVQG